MVTTDRLLQDLTHIEQLAAFDDDTTLEEAVANLETVQQIAFLALQDAGWKTE